MAQVIVQPAANSEARIHFANTIEKPVSLAMIRPHMSQASYKRLAGFYDGNEVWVWGVRPGVYNKWSRIQTGDTVMFYRDKRFIRTSIVTLVCQNRDLAINLWGQGLDSEPWEYIYFVNNLQIADIAIQDFCAVVQYKPNFTPQGLMVLDQQKSDSVLEKYGLNKKAGRPRKVVNKIGRDNDRPSNRRNARMPKLLEPIDDKEARAVETGRETVGELVSRMDALIHQMAGVQRSTDAANEFAQTLALRIDELTRETKKTQAEVALQLNASLAHRPKGLFEKLFGRPRPTD